MKNNSVCRSVTYGSKQLSREREREKFFSCVETCVESLLLFSSGFQYFFLYPVFEANPTRSAKQTSYKDSSPTQHPRTEIKSIELVPFFQKKIKIKIRNELTWATHTASFRLYTFFFLGCCCFLPTFHPEWKRMKLWRHPQE
jgi:hypothetical protein